MSVHQKDSPSLPAAETAKAGGRYAEFMKRFPLISRHLDEGSGVKVENLVGFTQVPLGLAGPLTIDGDHQKGLFHAPIATVEASLVASVNRGCKAFEQCGGVRAVASAETMGRAPIFVFRTIDDAVNFYERLPDLEARLRQDAESTSRFARLARLTPHIIGTYVHVHFEYTTGDAAGQNMAELATFKACSNLMASPLAAELGIIDIFPEGQLSGDKKMSAGRGVQPPRGVQVMAWGVLSDQVCQNILRCTTKRLYHGHVASMEGAIRNSLLGNAINPANIITGMFIATGQDAAAAVESSWAQLTLQYDEETKDLTVSMFFPSLIVGSVGGGTLLPTQKEGLEMLNCAGPGKKWALAETIAAFSLGLDMSVMAAVANNTHAAGHQRLARGLKL